MNTFINPNPLNLVLIVLILTLAINAVLWWPITKWGTALAIVLIILAPKTLPND